MLAYNGNIVENKKRIKCQNMTQVASNRFSTFSKLETISSKTIQGAIN